MLVGFSTLNVLRVPVYDPPGDVATTPDGSSKETWESARVHVLVTCHVYVFAPLAAVVTPVRLMV